MKVVGAILASILVVVVLVGVSFASETLSIKWKSHFNPQHENVKRETYEASRSFNVGKQQELAKYMYTFKRATDPIEKQAVAQMVRANMVGVDTASFPQEQQDFIYTCNNY